MATKLFGDIIFGPIQSRRLGVSLGVNLLPVDGKICNFNCCYCECGWTLSMAGLRFNDKEVVISALEQKLSQMATGGQRPDVITFAGNGEPTMHPHFGQIIDQTIALRDRLAPQAKVAVLSNATMLGRKEVRDALAKVDRAMLKIDSAIEKSIGLINDPHKGYSLDRVVEAMKLFEGELVIQTMLLRGESFDNTTPEEMDRYMEIIEDLMPKMVMLYTIDRDTPAENLEKATQADLDRLAERVRALGIECNVAKVK